MAVHPVVPRDAMRPAFFIVEKIGKPEGSLIYMCTFRKVVNEFFHQELRIITAQFKRRHGPVEIGFRYNFGPGPRILCDQFLEDLPGGSIFFFFI